MPSFLPLIFLTSISSSLASALQNLTPLPLTPGTCQSYPTSFRGAGDNADAFQFTPFLASSAITPLNGLKTKVINNTLVVVPSTYTGDAGSADGATIFCCDGGRVLDGFGVRELSIGASNINEMATGGREREGVLGYDVNGGARPETYALVQDNETRLGGVFLGKGNVTSWGFRDLGFGGFWGLRFLGGEREGGLRDGEVEGWLKVVGLEG